ncbi:MAG TPA: spherulation-specific family 4 protein [Pirellulales bacterium]|nr:spherulation-specific family 4 protein [Pirellulales bacterium]
MNLEPVAAAQTTLLIDRLAHFRHAWVVLMLLSACAVGGACPAADSPAKLRPTVKVKLFVPAYFYPAGEGLKEWDRLIAAAAVPIVAIANPASGPGERADPNHAKIIGRAARAGVTVIGYVSTQYAKKPRARVKAEIDRWKEFYPSIKGVFFDEQTSDASQVDYYRELFDYSRKKIKDGFVASNPGVACDVAYVTEACADLVCVFEHFEAYDDFTPPPAWGEKARRRAAVVPYQTTDADQMRQRLHRAAQFHLGYFYATDAGGANPWDRLPTYFDDEVAAVREVNRPRKK